MSHSFQTHIPTSNNRSRVFITGASGLVGAHLAERLLAAGKQVVGLYRSSIPQMAAADQIEWFKGDILDPLSLSEALTGVDEVYHCAAIVSFDPAQKDNMYQVNIEGTAHVVNASLQAGVRSLCHVSSVAALGRPAAGTEVNETMNWSKENHNSNYGKSKYLAEMEVWRGQAEGLQCLVVNPVIILGSANWNSGSAKLFKTAYNEFPWFSGGETGFVDVVDVVEAMYQLMEQQVFGQRLILSGHQLGYKELFTLMAECFGKKPPHKKVSPLLASLIWRLDAIKSVITGKKPLLTRETTQAAQAIVRYNNTRLFGYLPHFRYTPIQQTIARICQQIVDIQH